MSPNTLLKIVSAMQLNAVFFGIGIVPVLAVPALAVHARYLIPAVIALSFVLSFLFAGVVARRMRIRNWGRSGWIKGDEISG